MSFSSDIKQQLCVVGRGCPLCDVYELAGVAEFTSLPQDGVFRVSTENEYVADRIAKNMNIVFKTQPELVRRDKTIQLTAMFHDYVVGRMPTVPRQAFLSDEQTVGAENDANVFDEVKECCIRAYIRGCFLGGGSINDPKKSYHLEFDTKNPAGIDHLKSALAALGYTTKITYRKGHYLVYIKESGVIADILGFMGAGKGAMDLYTVQVEKEVRNNMNRRVNCETANVDKAVTAAAKHVAAIKTLIDNNAMENLPESLYQMAVIRLENPNDSLKELADKIGIGKSGVNHRLNRLIELAEEYR